MNKYANINSNINVNKKVLSEVKKNNINNESTGNRVEHQEVVTNNKQNTLKENVSKKDSLEFSVTNDKDTLVSNETKTQVKKTKKKSDKGELKVVYMPKVLQEKIENEKPPFVGFQMFVKHIAVLAANDKGWKKKMTTTLKGKNPEANKVFGIKGKKMSKSISLSFDMKITEKINTFSVAPFNDSIIINSMCIIGLELWDNNKDELFM